MSHSPKGSDLLRALRRPRPATLAGEVGAVEDFPAEADPQVANTGEPIFEISAQDVTWSPLPLTSAILTPDSNVAEEFRLLRAKIRAISERRPVKCLGFVSAASGEGKTTVSIGLALAQAQDPDRRVLLIEADLRRPAIEKCLGLPVADGLAEFLEEKSASVPLRRLSPQGFFLLSAGRSELRQPEVLGSERMARMLQAARINFDFVIVDCPPLVPVADSVILQDLLDGFVFVVRARHSPRETIERALSHMKHDRIIGTVYNAPREYLPGYHGYGNRKYGYRS